MKLLITGIVALITLAVGFWGCNDLSRTTYSGSDYVMFSDTLSMYPVQDSEKWFEIPVKPTLYRLRSICLRKMKIYGICTVHVLVFKCKKHVLSNLVHLKAIVY